MIHLKVLSIKQRLYVFDDNRLLQEYVVSTARNGLGEELHSEKTPRGWHTIRAKIGAECPIYSVFQTRRPTGEIYTAELAASYPNRDWILSRILWLSGLEPGKNRLGLKDTMRRYIYIHGTAYEDRLGNPVSHGCIRMNNQDVIDLFNVVPAGARIYIE